MFVRAPIHSLVHTQGTHSPMLWPFLGLHNVMAIIHLLASSCIRAHNDRLMNCTPLPGGVQAAQDNSFMHTAAKPGEGNGLTREVLGEFSQLYHQLSEVHGVNVGANLAVCLALSCFYTIVFQAE